MDYSLIKGKDSKLEEYYQSIPNEIKNKIDIKMRNSLCKIEYKESKIGNGFLCKISISRFF